MTKGGQLRLTACRLKVLKQAADGQDVARVCRRFGISRESFYKWKGRGAEHGDAGLGDHPRTPAGATTGGAKPTGQEDVEVCQSTRTLEARLFGAARSADYSLDVPIASLQPGPNLLAIEATMGARTERRNLTFVVH